MCRHAAYVGAPLSLRHILWDTPHSLKEQARRPRELLVGSTCADGFGVGWYDPDAGPEAARYANPMPLWADTNVPDMGIVHGLIQIAAVRDATVEGTNTPANCHPFKDDRFLFSHNGYLEDFQGSWREDVLDLIAPERRLRIKGTTDSEHVFQAVLTEHDRLVAGQEAGVQAGHGATHPGMEHLALAVQTVLSRLLELGQKNGRKCQLNVLLSDGTQVVVTREGNQPACNSLYLLREGDETPDGVLVASEALDDDDWEAVQEGTLLVLRDGAPVVRMNL